MTPLPDNTIAIRPYLPGDLSALLHLNNLAVPAVSELTAEELLDLIGLSLICLVATKEDEPIGLLLCIGEGTDYKSKNYRWISERIDSFAYTDRIYVDETHRGKKIGDKLYAALFDYLKGSERCFVCEVNERPPNPGSLRFHKSLGFEEIGTADHGDTAVIYMKRQPEPAV
ncbi:MAG: GNAT family N-acetyltransferase [Roseibium sp.]